MTNSLKEKWSSLSTGYQRVLIGIIISFDAVLGLLNQSGFLNLLDSILFDNLPTDMVWLLQTLQLICMGILFVKVIFDDLAHSPFRSALMFFSPILLTIHTLLSLHLLLAGQDLEARIIFDFGALARSTLTWSSTYLAIAVGCTLTYSVQRYGNFAQSEYFMLGMYVGIAFMWTDWLFPLSDAPADGTLVWTLFIYVLIGAFVLTGLAGIIIDRLVFKGFRDRHSSADVMMIASLGVAMILRALVYLRFGANTKRFNPDTDWMLSEQRWEIPTITTRLNLGSWETPTFEFGTTNYAYNNAFLPLISFCAVILLLLLLTRTRLGRRMRAVADNPELAASSGINVERVQITSAFLSAGISGLGGAVFGLTVLFSPQTAFTLLLPAFAVIVLGTIGSVPGAIVASLIIGFVRAISEPVLSGIGNPLERTNYFALGEVIPYVIIIAILLIMPEGIGHAYDKWKIERLRSRAASKKTPNAKISALIGVLFGWAGGHQFHQQRSARGLSMLIVTVFAFGIGKATSFMREHSFVGQEVTSAPQHLDESMHADWLNLIHTEQTMLEAFGLIGDIIWPAIPILVYLLALVESYMILKGKYVDLLQTPMEKTIATVESITGAISDFSMKVTKTVTSTSGAFDPQLDRLNEVVASATSRLVETVQKASSSLTKGIESPYGIQSDEGSKKMFYVMFFVLTLVVLWLPSIGTFAKVLQVSNFIVTLSIFLILAYSLNLHTGMTGLLNFGVIFFAAIGSIVVGILTAPSELYGYDWPILPALIVAMLVGALAGWLLAYPTARLRSDYFAIITISLGEIVRILLMGEPLLRAGGNESAIGIQRYPLPLQEWWFCGSNPPLSSSGEKLSPIACSTTEGISSVSASIGDLLGLGQPAPYLMLLAFIGIIGVAICWKALDMLFDSPWGRILRSIREDEEVAQHHGHDILTHKASSLALGAAIAAFAGALWAWKLNGFQPSFMSPAKSTFLVWAAFIIGGAANNRGMLIGAMIITLTEFFFNVLVAAQGSSSLPLAGLADLIDEIFVWLVSEPYEVAILFVAIMLLASILRKREIAETSFWFAVIFMMCGMLFDERSIEIVFPTILGGIKTKMAYVKVMLIGVLIMTSLKYNPKGLLPEVPYRPERQGEAESQ